MPLEWVVIGAIVFLAALVIAIFAGKRRDTASLYQPGRELFSAAERSFLGVLDQAVGQKYRVFGKVRVADVIAVRSGLNGSVRQSAFNRISAKHFDFIVCREDDLAVVCVVELNDKSHVSKRAQSRDAFLTDVCRHVNLPLITVSAKRSYSLQDVRDQFMSAVTPAAADRIVA